MRATLLHALSEAEATKNGARLADYAKDIRAMTDLLDWAETLLCNAEPIKDTNCSPEEWRALVAKWRDQKHGQPETLIP